MINDLLSSLVPDRNEFFSEDFVKQEFEVYYNFAKFLNPLRVLEVGVFKGYSACAIIHGAKNLKYYQGIDAELYVKDSNKIAIDNISKFLKITERDLFFNVINRNTQTDEVAKGESGINFDWIHIDAGHEASEAYKDIMQFWPITTKVMTVHDVISHPPVQLGLEKAVFALGEEVYARLRVQSNHGFEILIKK